MPRKKKAVLHSKPFNPIENDPSIRGRILDKINHTCHPITYNRLDSDDCLYPYDSEEYADQHYMFDVMETHEIPIDKSIIYWIEVVGLEGNFYKVGRCNPTEDALIKRIEECFRWNPSAKLCGYFFGQKKTESLIHSILQYYGHKVPGKGNELFYKNEFTEWLMESLCEDMEVDLGYLESALQDQIVSYYYDEKDFSAVQWFIAQACKENRVVFSPEKPTIILSKKERRDQVLSWLIFEKEYEDDTNPQTLKEVELSLKGYKPEKPDFDEDY